MSCAARFCLVSGNDDVHFTIAGTVRPELIGKSPPLTAHHLK